MPIQKPKEQVREMLGSEGEEFRESLPENTNEPVDTGEQPRQRKQRVDAGKPRTRKPKVQEPAEIDPILERAKRKFQALGSADVVKGAFRIMDKPLTPKEVEDVDDYFYLVSKNPRIPVADPTQSLIALGVIFFVLMFKLSMERSSFADTLKELFKKKPAEKKPEQDAVEGEAVPVELPVSDGDEE